MEAKDEVSEIKECKHIFHTTCINQWLEQKNECPLCKVSIDCYGPEEEHGPFRHRNPEIELMMNTLVNRNHRMDQYFREMRELHQEAQNVNPNLFVRGGAPVGRRNRELIVAIIALNAQLAQMRQATRDLDLIRHHLRGRRPLPPPRYLREAYEP